MRGISQFLPENTNASRKRKADHVNVPEDAREWSIPALNPTCFNCSERVTQPLAPRGPCANPVCGFLGQGGFGSVFVGVPKDDKKDPVALKVCKHNHPNAGSLKGHIDKEINAMQKLSRVQSKHIVKYIAHWEDADCTTIVVPLLGDDIFTHIENQWKSKRKPLAEADLFDMVFQIVDAVKSMHDLNFCHFDIKLENINYKNKDPDCNQVQLIDLGLAVEMPPSGWPVRMPKVQGKRTHRGPHRGQPSHASMARINHTF
jgi:serine/threonine protein kinase